MMPIISKYLFKILTLKSHKYLVFCDNISLIIITMPYQTIHALMENLVGIQLLSINNMFLCMIITYICSKRFEVFDSEVDRSWIPLI